MKKLIRSFEPVVSPSARVLILGSMPGEQSLARGQYYAHPRNAFWTVMQEVAGVDPAGSYEERIEALKLHGIALWDVLHSCHREGSLDAAIESGSVKVNDIKGFLLRHPAIRLVLFNGGTAERYYRRYVLPEMKNEKIEHLCLPSTSPAHAARSLQQKVTAWREGIAHAVRNGAIRLHCAYPGPGQAERMVGGPWNSKKRMGKINQTPTPADPLGDRRCRRGAP